MGWHPLILNHFNRVSSLQVLLRRTWPLSHSPEVRDVVFPQGSALEIRLAQRLHSVPEGSSPCVRAPLLRVVLWGGNVWAPILSLSQLPP